MISVVAGSARLKQRAASMPLWLVLGLRGAVFAQEAVAVNRAAPSNHHVAIFDFGHAGHGAGHLLETLAVCGAEFRQEVDVAAKGNGLVQIGVQHRLLLRFGHRPFIEVFALTGLEALAVFGFHERHAELVEVIARAGLVHVKQRRARHVQIGFFEGHKSISTTSKELNNLAICK